jgi:hypothetical protein
MNRGILLSLLSLVMGLLVCCEDYKDCNSPVETSLGIRFYRQTHDTDQDTTLPGLTVYGIGRADSLLADTLPASSLFVPLRQDMDTTAFFLKPDSTRHTGDTLTLAYTRTLHFISSGCGFTTYYQLDTVYSTRHFIDSLAVPQKKIVTTHATNVKLYY